MPLVVPGIQSKDGNDDWSTKLMGKSIGESHNETVRSHVSYRHPASTPYPVPFSRQPYTEAAWPESVQTFANTQQTFAKQDLPKEHRVVQPGSMMTMDHKPDRLNIHVGDDGTVQKVRYG